MSSLADKILAADDLTAETVDIPEWGVKVELRTPSGAERASLLRQTVDDDGEQRHEDWSILWPLAFIACAHDPETGERIFEWDQADALQSKNGAVLARLGDRCLDIAGLKADSLEGAKKSTLPST